MIEPSITRLEQFRLAIGLNSAKFCSIIGVAESTYSLQKKRKSEVSENVIVQLKLQYPQLNLDWLIMAQGNMWLNQDENGGISEPVQLPADVDRLRAENNLLRDQIATLKELVELLKSKNVG